MQGKNKRKFTPEFKLKHRNNGSNAVVQVKSEDVSLNIDDYANLETDVFLFATNGKYFGTPRTNIKTVDPKVIRQFLYDKTHLLPDKMKTWVEISREELTNDGFKDSSMLRQTDIIS